MDKDTIIKMGLSEGEAITYLALLELGPSTAATVIKKTGLKRGTAYNMIRSLIEKNLAKEKHGSGIAIFQLEHPIKLKEYLEKLSASTEYAQKILTTSIETLISQFNLANNKPGIQHFEGKEGVLRLVDDLLTSKTPIYLYADFAAVQKYIPDVQEIYAKRQKARGIVRKGIIIGSKEYGNVIKKNRSLYEDRLTPTKYITEHLDPFHAVMEIYDGKIAYITLSESGITSTIIRDQGIYQMHKYIFEKLWNSLPS